MIIDTSALCCVLFAEPDASTYLEALARSERKLLSSVNALEAGLVAESRLGTAGATALAELIQSAEIDVVAFDAALAEVALDAWRRYGKGRHPASLNLGDCAAYALAKVTNQPLLYKGTDFPLTDLVSARTFL